MVVMITVHAARHTGVSVCVCVCQCSRLCAGVHHKGSADLNIIAIVFCATLSL